MKWYKSTIVVFTEERPDSFHEAALEAEYGDAVLAEWLVEEIEDVHDDPNFPQEWFD